MPAVYSEGCSRARVCSRKDRAGSLRQRILPLDQAVGSASFRVGHNLIHQRSSTDNRPIVEAVALLCECPQGTWHSCCDGNASNSSASRAKSKDRVRRGQALRPSHRAPSSSTCDSCWPPFATARFVALGDPDLLCIFGNYYGW